MRIGPNYSYYKKKAPSESPIYTIFAADCFATHSRIDHATERFILPPEIVNSNTFHPHIPAVFVVQIQIPSDAPPMFSTVTDGPGWSIMFYFRLSQSALSELENHAMAAAPLSPALNLWGRWCQHAMVDVELRKRFKVIDSCSNLAELGVSSTIQAWNAKPVLIRRTGSLYRGNGYMEFDIHVHKFDNLAKTMIHQLSSRVGQMYMNIGFVIEGRSDDELPECLFGCVGVNKMLEQKAEFLFDE